MTKPDYSSMSLSDLHAAFEKMCLDQYEAKLDDDIKKVNRIFKALTQVRLEVKARGVEARLSFLPFLTHSNSKVRLVAAKWVYPVAPTDALKCLEALSAARILCQSLDAGMTLIRLKEVPDCLD